MTAPTENVGRYGIGTGFRIHLLFPAKQSKKDIRLDVLLREFLSDQFFLDIFQGGFDGFLFILCVFVKLAESTAILV